MFDRILNLLLILAWNVYQLNADNPYGLSADIQNST